MVIATEFPRHRDFPPGNPWGHGVSFDLEYQIHVPRDARLVVSGVMTSARSMWTI